MLISQEHKILYIMIFFCYYLITSYFLNITVMTKPLMYINRYNMQIYIFGAKLLNTKIIQHVENIFFGNLFKCLFCLTFYISERLDFNISPYIKI